MEKNKILVCAGTSGIAAGAEKVVKNFNELLVKHGLDKNYVVVKSGDRGLFRDVLVDIFDPKLGRIVYQYVKPEDVEKIVDEHLVNGEPVKKLQADPSYDKFFAEQKRVVLVNCGEIDPEDLGEYVAAEGYDALKKVLDMDGGNVVEEVKQSGLRGRGGGGFSTGLKWHFCRIEKSEKKYVVCNADEGDPGAFMDRAILEGDPHCVLEGMAIAGYAIGADTGYIYCRAEYPLAIKRLEIAIEQAKQKNLLGENILGSGFNFDVIIKQGAGAFVCGEETALMKSIEGKRGNPVPKPPFAAQCGLWEKPTLINNVETFANIRHIILKGSEWFASIGVPQCEGTKVFALAGKLKNTGLVEVPMGTTIRELIDGPGGGMVNKKAAFKGVQLGGPSGGTLPESLLDTPIDFKSITATGAIMGSGGMIVMDETTCMVDLAKFFINFTVAESCGKCVPCRMGLKNMLKILKRICDGEGEESDLETLQDLGNNIIEASLCGLGKTAPKPVLTTIKYFYDEYMAHIKDKECPAHICTELIKFEVDADKCIKCGACFKICPVDAIVWKKGEVARIDKDKCIRCKSCISACNKVFAIY
jgi:NADH-quinone oxidoreductase subunit F